MTRTIMLIIKDENRTQDELDITALKLMDSIQETSFNNVGLRISRPAKFCIKANILYST